MKKHLFNKTDMILSKNIAASEIIESTKLIKSKTKDQPLRFIERKH